MIRYYFIYELGDYLSANPFFALDSVNNTSETFSGSSRTGSAAWLATFKQLGEYSLASPERGVALTQEEFPETKASAACPGLPSCLKVTITKLAVGTK
jgi:hypothetical protein